MAACEKCVLTFRLVVTADESEYQMFLFYSVEEKIKLNVFGSKGLRQNHAPTGMERRFPAVTEPKDSLPYS